MSSLIIGDKQILPEKPEVVTGYTVNRTYVPNQPNNKVFVHRVGNIVQLQADFASGVNLPAGTTVTLISGLPRTYDIVELQTTSDISSGQYSRSWIDQNGNLLIHVNPAYTQNIFIGGVYITKD